MIDMTTDVIFACDACPNEERLPLPISISFFLAIAKDTRCTECGKPWSTLRNAPSDAVVPQ